MSHAQETQDAHISPHRQTLAESQQGDAQAEIDEPYFPDLDTAVEANQAALGGFGQTNHALLRPDVLEGALGRAQNQYHYTHSMANAAAALAHGVGAAQAFEDGNKRTAYWLTHHFLRENGYGPETMPDDDEELADHLIGHGEGTHSMEDTANLFRSRGRISKRWTRIVSTQDDDAFFEDYVRVALASEPPRLPPHSMRLGHTTATWFSVTPGVAHVIASGGSIEDREFACRIVEGQLAGHGIERAQYHLDWDHSDTQMIKEADWNDIEAKAKRLIQSGKVHILRNSPEFVVAHVEGDHGDYTSEITRQDPTSQAISLWSCGCKWDQFAWQRTRQWKKYEGRVCSHVLAAFWLAQTMPMDEEIGPTAEGPQGPSGGQPEGQPAPSPFAQVPGGGTGMVPPATAPGPQQPGMQNQTAPMPPAQMPPPGQAPEPPELIPQYPHDPALQPAINPVSVPGLKPQTPLNPMQSPGGTFSHIAAEQFVNGQMVQLKQEDVGQTVGLNSGQAATIPANSIGEVLGTDPLGLVNVYFAGPQSQAGILQPHGVTGWFWAKDLIPRPDILPAGPAVRRR